MYVEHLAGIQKVISNPHYYCCSKQTHEAGLSFSQMGKLRLREMMWFIQNDKLESDRVKI